MTTREKAEKIVHDLNDRSIHIWFEDDIMEEIYQEISDTIDEK